MSSPYQTHPYYAMTIISRLFTLPPAQTNLAGAMWILAKARMARRKSQRAFPLERGLWAMAACFYSLPIRCNTEEAVTNDSSRRPVCFTATCLDPAAGIIDYHRRRDLVRAYAGG